MQNQGGTQARVSPRPYSIAIPHAKRPRAMTEYQSDLLHLLSGFEVRGGDDAQLEHELRASRERWSSPVMPGSFSSRKGLGGSMLMGSNLGIKLSKVNRGTRRRASSKRL